MTQAVAQSFTALPVPLIDDLRDAWRHEPREHRLALLVILIVAILLRLLYLVQPIRNDEAVTYLDFIRLPWGEVFGTYTPNNHVFHTLLAKAAVSIARPEPWVLRLPAFIAGVLIVPAAYAVARARHDGRVALVVAALVATSGMLILYSTNARGYSMVVLAFLLLVRIAIRILDGEAGAAPFMSFALIGALGLWTTPIMAYPLGTVSLWVVFTAVTGGNARVARQMFLAFAAAVALALLLHVPVLTREGMEALTTDRLLPSAGWFEFFQTLPRSLAVAVVSWSAGVPMLSVALVLLALLSLRRPSRIPVGLGLAAFCWCSWLLLVTHRAPFPRVWLWLYPVIAMGAAVEIVAVLEGRARTRTLVERAGVSSAVFALVLAVSVVTTRAVPTSTETGSFRDAGTIAQELGPNLGPADVVMAAVPSNGPLSYYFRRAGITPTAIPLDSARRVFVIVDVAEGQTLDLLTQGSVVRDTSQFVQPRVVGTFTTSGIFLYSRRNVTAR